MSPTARKESTLPTPQECRRILRAHRVPDHIRRHSEQVARVARRLAKALSALDGEVMNIDRVEAAALLHDIAKADCLRSRKDHAREGGRVLRDLGMPEIATLVEQHVVLHPGDHGGRVTEAEVLNYSDKRVRHEEIVTLEERFTDLIERYGRGNPQAEAIIRENWLTTEVLERKIFARLPSDPGILEA